MDCIEHKQEWSIEMADELIARLNAVADGLFDLGHLHSNDVVRQAARALAEERTKVAALTADAERYRAWRASHAAGMRPFLPSEMPAKAGTSWTHPFDYDPPNDEWMTATPEKRADMIDAVIDTARAAIATKEGIREA